VWQSLLPFKAVRCHGQGGTLVFPWSLVYDLALEPSGQLSECPGYCASGIG